MFENKLIKSRIGVDIIISGSDLSEKVPEMYTKLIF